MSHFGVIINLAGVVIMTHNDVIDVIWSQIRTPGARISIQKFEFWPDWTNIEKRIYRKLAISGQPVWNSKKLNQGTHPEFNSLSANIWFHGVSKNDEAVVTKYIQKNHLILK